MRASSTSRSTGCSAGAASCAPAPAIRAWRRWRRPRRGLPRPRRGPAEPSPPAAPVPPRNAEVGGPARFAARIPAYGQAVGGKDGEFILNGNRIVDILAPPSLQGVPDAYAVPVV